EVESRFTLPKRAPILWASGFRCVTTIRSDKPREDFSPFRPAGADAMIHDRLKPALAVALMLTVTALVRGADAPKLEIEDVEGQPLAANVERLLQALEFLGTKLPEDTTKELLAAAKERNAKKLQELLDPHVLALVTLSPESRVKAARGPADAKLQQGGYV